MNKISVNDLQQKIMRNEIVHLIDVRTSGEFSAEHAVSALNFPLDIVSKKTLEQTGLASTDEPLYIICQGGGRSSKAIEKLEAEGIQNLFNVEGGTNAWIAAKLATEKGSGVISLERQVRIAAGALIFFGVVMGHFIHPGFYLIPGFVGVGLIFAGISDWCGMGLLMARMPWNQK